MSKGNINYKYLRKRRNNRRKKIISIILIIAIIVLILGLGGCLVYNLIGNSSDNKQDKSGNLSGNSNVANEEGNNKNSDKTNVVWIDDKEPNETKEVDYKAPEDVEFPYFIKVNRAANCVTVYGIDDNGEYSIPVKAFVASCGKPGDETIIGENYKTTDKYVWRLMVDSSYGHYAFRINGGYLFHSVPFLKSSSDSLETDQFNKLGTFASLGCVRMCVRDVKWLYDNCPSGTKVTIYDDETNPGPLGKPEMIKIPLDSPNAGWDPTDPDENNPWLKCSAKINVAEDKVTKVGEKVDLLQGVTATDTCGNDITDKVKTVGHYTFDEVGEYDIKYVVTDAIGSKAEANIKLKVEK